MQSRRTVRDVLGLLTAITLLHWAGVAALAQEDDEDEPAAKTKATLKAGDKAPPLQVANFVKGGPVAKFESGKVYVVEFWATWCGPCIASMPHLSAVQKEFKDKGVTVIGVNVWEDAGGKKYTDDTAKNVEKFVKDQGPRMEYVVAYDGPDKNMANAYMKAAGQNGIPCSFVIDQTGTIAWIGHPSMLELPLGEVVNKTWDVKKGPEKLQNAQKMMMEIAQKVESSPEDAVKAWDKLEQDYPAFTKLQPMAKFTILLKAGDYDRAYKFGGQVVEEATAKKDAETLNAIAWTIVDPQGNVKRKDLDLALKAANKADELTEHKDGATIDTVARVYFLKGDVDKAIELENEAIKMAPAGMKPQLREALDEYKEAKDKGGAKADKPKKEKSGEKEDKGGA